jgi:hypothetical protein
MVDDPRSFSRISLDRGAQILVGNNAPFHAEIINLSMSGLLLRTDQHLELGTECRLSIPLTEGGEMQVEAMATVVRTTADGFAINFTKLLGVESYGHLRSLLLYNATDPDRIEEEFKAHYGIR